jgi:predicted secreted hydrolase
MRAATATILATAMATAKAKGPARTLTRTLPVALVMALTMLLPLSACSRQDSPTAASEADARTATSTPDSSSSPADGNRLAALRADSMPQGFALVTEPRMFEFPRDHGPHPEFRHEWWYVTGHLDAANGDPFGFELTFFRFALKPPEARAEPSDTSGVPANMRAVPPDAPSHAPLRAPLSTPLSAWRSRQLYMAHFAVSDIARNDFRVAERFARDALGLAGARAEPFDVTLDNWSLGVAESATAPNTWRLVAADKGYSLDITLTPASSIMLNGDAGLSRKSDAAGAASYYYSIPRMTARGKLIRDGKPLDVTGTVWLDREWGSGSLGSDQQGWDWFALQMDDGSALMFYALRKRNGDRDAHSAGTWLAPDGSTRSLSSDDVLIESKGEWTSPRGGRYPARWQLRVPSLQLDVDIQPRLADQELNTSTRYWEGASTVAGTLKGQEIRGKAYVELVGYATAPTARSAR